MTPSEQAKAAGLQSLSQVSRLTGVSLQTLTNWHSDKPQLFKAVLAGCIAGSKANCWNPTAITTLVRCGDCPACGGYND
ncbi:MAG: hypothetical protein ACYS6K_29675 [Planctomycetota bacterium]